MVAGSSTNSSSKPVRKTRGEVKGVEIAAALMTLGAGSTLYFLAAAIVDHWLLPHGMGFWGRLLCLAMFLAGAGYFAVRELLPAIVYRINPIYAAKTIESSRPSLKNSLINFLFLRDRQGVVPRAVFEAVEQQAANGLSHGAIESAVDRSRLIHVGYALVAIVALFAAYCIFSPKNPLDTVGRVMMPWADIQPPTRVSILDVKPGDKMVFRGEPVEISAELHGNLGDEPVRVFYTTADRQVVDRPVIMHLAHDGYRHTARIPADENGAEDSRGLQQDAEYRIEAGDAITQTFHLRTEIAPTISIDSVDLDFPAYTGRARQHLEHAGDIQALEGTRVTIHGRANQEIHSADLELQAADRVVSQPLQIDKLAVTGSFTLALDETDRTQPTYSHYRLRPDHRAEPEPVQHRIEVTPDLPPEVKFLAPEKEDATLPANGRLTLELRAEDPDFALTEVDLSATSNGRSVIAQQWLLHEPVFGPLNKKYLFDLAKLGLKDGETVEYWATARDNREPSANETVTGRRRIRIVAAERRRSSAGKPGQERQDNNADQPPPDEQNPADRDPNDPNQKPPHREGDREKPPKAGQNQERKNNPQQPNQDEPQEKQQEGQKQNGADNKQDPNKQNPDNKNSDNKNSDNQKQQGGDNKQQQGGGEQQKSGGGDKSQSKQGGSGDQSGDKSNSGEKSSEKPSDKPGSQKQDGAGQSADQNAGGDQQQQQKGSQQKQSGNKSGQD